MSRDNDYTSENVLDLYHQNYYKLTGIDLSRQANISIPQQINFTKNIGEDDGETIFFMAEKQQKTILKLCLYSLIVTEK